MESGPPPRQHGHPRPFAVKAPMTALLPILDRIPLNALLIVALGLGLAPFFPEPHLWEKLKMLAAGTLRRPVDIFDFLMHGLPVVVLALKLIRMATRG